jgi:chloramphenicol-sensitive protein RarD
MLIDDRTTRAGLSFGVGAYVLWGLLPLYLKLLENVPPPQVVAHRVVWSLILVALIVIFTRRIAALRQAARGRTLLLLATSALLISINWLVYIWAVQHNHVLEASLGYFITPLVNVGLGILILKERLRRWQIVSVAVASVGVVVAAVGGQALWISFTLAATFGLYGLIRKVAAIEALEGLTVETLLLMPVALAVLGYASTTGTGVFGKSTGLDILLIGAGAVTAAPLLMFAAAARRLQYSTIGLLQYIAPSIMFLEAMFVFHEPVQTKQFLVFGSIWTGCAIYAWDSLRAARKTASTSG